MAKLIPYDVEDVEASGGGGSVEPKPAVYPAIVRICEARDTKADGTPANDIRVALDLGGDYRWLFTYIGLGEASDWKLAEFVRALGLKEKGKLDPEKMIGKMIRVKVNPDTYEGEYQGKAGRLMKALPDDELPEATPAGKEEGGEEDEPPADEDTPAEADGDFEPTRENPDDEEVGSYDDWDDSDLEEEVSDRELTVAGGRGKKRDKWIKSLREDDAASGEEGPGNDGGSGDSEDTPEDDYDTWEVELFAAEFKDRELDLPTKPKGKNASDRYKAALIAALREDDEANPFEPES